MYSYLNFRCEGQNSQDSSCTLIDEEDMLNASTEGTLG